MRNTKEPSGTVDLRAARLNISEGTKIISVDDLREIASKLESGEFGLDKKLHDVPDVVGKKPSEAISLLKNSYKVALGRWASGVGLKEEAASALRAYIDYTLNFYDKIRPAIINKITTMRKSMYDTSKSQSDRDIISKVVDEEKDNLRNLESKLSELEKYFDGNRYGRSISDKNKAKAEFYRLLQAHHDEISPQYYGKSIAKSGTARIAEHITAAPPEEGKIEYNHVRSLVQFYAKTMRIAKNGGDLSYKVLPNNTVEYVDEEYNKSVNKLLSSLTSVVYDDDPLVAKDGLYGKIDFALVEKLAREFNIPLKPEKEVKNKRLAEKFYSAIPVRVTAILQKLFSVAVSACMKVVRFSEGSKSREELIDEATKSVENFLEVYLVLGKDASGVSLSKLTPNGYVYAALAKYDPEFFKNIVVKGVIKQEPLINALEIASPSVRGPQYVFTDKSISQVIKFAENNKDDIFVSTAIEKVPVDYVKLFIDSAPKLISNEVNSLIVRLNSLIKSNNNLHETENNLASLSRLTSKIRQLVQDNGIRYLSDIKSRTADITDGDFQIKTDVLDRLESAGKSGDNSVYLSAISQLNKYLSKLSEVIKNTNKSITKTIDSVIPAKVSEVRSMVKEAAKYDIRLDYTFIDNLLKFAQSINSISDIPDRLPDSISSDISEASLPRENSSLYGVPDIFTLIVNAASIGATQQQSPLARGKKRRQKILASPSAPKEKQIAAYSRLTRTKRERERIGATEDSVNIDTGRSPWYYVYIPVMNSVRGRAIPAVSMLGPYRAKEAFAVQTSLIRTAPPRLPFKATLTKKDDLYAAMELMRSISAADPNSTLLSKLEGDVASLSKIPDSLSRIKSLQTKNKEELVQLLDSFRKYDPSVNPEMVFNAYAENLASKVLGEKINDDEYVLTLADVSTGMSKAYSMREDRTTLAELDSIKAIVLLMAVLNYEVQQVDTDDEFLFKSLSARQDALIATLNGYSNIKDNAELIDQVYDAILGADGLYGVDSTNIDPRDFDKFQKFEKSILGYFIGSKDKFDERIRSNKVSDKIDRLNRRLDLLGKEYGETVEKETEVSRRVIDLMSKMVGTRCVVIDMRKFVHAVGDGDYEEIAQSIYANERATIGNLNLNVMGIIGAIQHYMANFMVIHYGKSSFFGEDDEEDDDDEEESNVTAGLTLFQAAEKYSQLKEERYRCGIFYVAMLNTSERKKSDSEAGSPSDLLKEGLTKLGKQDPYGVIIDTHRQVKFNPVRFWKHYQAATKEVFKEEYEGLEASEIDPLDHDGEESTILDEATYIPVIKGIYPVASKRFYRVDEGDIEDLALSEAGRDFLLNDFVGEFMSEVERLYSEQDDDIMDFRNNPSSVRRTALKSKIYILWFLEAYDATKKSGLTNNQRLEVAHKATLDEMVAEGYTHQDGTLTDLGIDACSKVTVTPYAKDRFDTLVVSAQISSAVKGMRDNPKGFPLTGESATVREGGRRQFIQSTDMSDLSPAGTEVIMYRPKIVANDATGGKKFYRPRIYLTVPKDITLVESDQTRQLIRDKALRSVTFDPSSRRYVHTPAGPMTEADRIAFYLDSMFQSRVKEVAPVKRLQKGAGPRGKDLQTKIVEESIGGKFMPFSGITETTPRNMILQSLQYNYLIVRKNSDNKSLLNGQQLKIVADATLKAVYDQFIISNFPEIHPKKILQLILSGISDVYTLMRNVKSSDTVIIAGAINDVPDILVTIGDENSILKEFVVGKVTTKTRAIAFATTTSNIKKIMSYMEKAVDGMLDNLKAVSGKS